MVNPAIFSTGLVGAIIFLGVLLILFSKRTQTPYTLLLLILGFIIGPILGIFDPSKYGAFTNTLIMVALVVLLFDAGHSVNIKRLKQNLSFTLLFSLLPFLLTVGGTFLFAKYLLGLNNLFALLLGALVGSTDLTIMHPILENLKLKPKVKESMEIESTLNSVYAAVLAIVLVSILRAGEFSAAILTTTVVMHLIGGAAIGLIGGFALLTSVRKLKQDQDPELISLAVVLVIFALAEIFGGSGILAAFAAGVLFGNLKPAPPKIVKSFNGSLEVILVTFLYIVLGSLIDPFAIGAVWFYAVLLISLLILLRFIGVYMITPDWDMFSRNLAGLGGARGIVSIVLILSYAALFPEPKVVLGLGFFIVFMTSLLLFYIPIVQSWSKNP